MTDWLKNEIAELLKERQELISQVLWSDAHIKHLKENEPTKEKLMEELSDKIRELEYEIARVNTEINELLEEEIFATHEGDVGFEIWG